MDESRAAISQSDLMAFIEHEVRNSATILLGNASALQRQQFFDSRLAEPACDYISAIEEETRNLTSFISTLVNVWKRYGAPVIEPARLDDIVPNVVSRLSSGWQGRQFEVDVPPGLPEVLVSRPLMEVVLKNLLSNSHKYSPIYHPVLVTAWEEDRSVRLSIRDAGYVSQSEIVHIFEMAYRSDRFTEVEGTGVGLAECRTLLKLMDASLHADRHEGEGLEVLLEFRALPASKAA